MHPRKLLLLASLISLVAPASASAYFGHVVTSGESLYSVAATDGLSVSQLAAANGISPGSHLIAGSTLQIPPQSAGENPAPVAADGSASSGTSASGSQSSEAPAASSTSSSGSGGYTVQHGDTLSAIAVRYGTTVDQLAAANGLDSSGILPTGFNLSVGGGSSAGTSSSSDAASSSDASSSSAESASTSSGSDSG